MRTLFLLLFGMVVGAMTFHLYYLSIERAARCGWDHSVGWASSDACRMDAVPAQYDGVARRKLDALIEDVAR